VPEASLASLAPPGRGAVVRAVAAVLAGGLLALSAIGGGYLAAAVVLLLGLALGYGLPRLLDLPAGTGAAWVLCCAVPVIIVGQWFGGLQGTSIIVAGAVVLAFFHQMLRRDGRPRLTESVAGDVIGLVLVTFGAGWITAARAEHGHGAMLVGGAALVIGSACAVLPVGTVWSVALGVLLGGGAGVGLGVVVDGVGPLRGAVLGLAVALVAGAGHRTAARSPSAAFVRPARAAAVIPPLAAGALVGAAVLITI
jgi:hypothetical protein